MASYTTPPTDSTDCASSGRETAARKYYGKHTIPNSQADIVYEKLSKLFFWPRMDKAVKYYTASCDTCQRIKSRTQRMNGLLEPHDIPPYPFHTVAMDL